MLKKIAYTYLPFFVCIIYRLEVKKWNHEKFLIIALAFEPCKNIMLQIFLTTLVVKDLF